MKREGGCNVRVEGRDFWRAVSLCYARRGQCRTSVLIIESERADWDESWSDDILRGGGGGHDG